MDLSYLFNKKEPTNYVEQASQDPIAKFLEEKAMKSQKVKQPITPEKEQIIKKNFSINPQVQQKVQMESQPESPVQQEDTQVQQPYQEPAPQPDWNIPSETIEESINYETLPEEFKKNKDLSLSDRAEKMLPERTWKDFLPYLAPLLVEGLMGVNADAAGISGQALLDAEQKRMQRKQSLEDKLLDMEKARLLRKTNLGKGAQVKSLRNKSTGESEIGYFDPRTQIMTVRGRPVDTSEYELAPGLSTQEFIKRSDIGKEKQKELGDYFGRGVRIDPDTLLLSRVVNGKLVPIQTARGILDPGQVKQLDSIVRGFKTTDIYKKNADTLGFAGTLKSLIQENNPISLEMAKSELAKAAEGGGRLTKEDVERLGGSRAIKDQARRFAYLQKTGKSLTPKDRKDMMRVAQILEERARKNLSSSIMGLEQDFIQRGGIAGAVQTALNPYAPQLYQNQSAKPSKSGTVLVKNVETGQVGDIPAANLERALKSKKFILVNQNKK